MADIPSDALFVVAAQGDGCHSMLVRGPAELRTSVCACLWMGGEQDAPDDVLTILATLDDPDEWSGGLPFFSWDRSFEDGSISVQRVVSTSVQFCDGKISPGIMERTRTTIAAYVRRCDLQSRPVGELEYLERLVARALQAERNLALDDAAQWHEEAKTPERGADYGLINEYERREVRKSNEAHSFAAAAIRALNTAPKQETDHERG